MLSMWSIVSKSVAAAMLAANKQQADDDIYDNTIQLKLIGDR